MSFLTNLVPTNLNEEQAKFFANENYNPQFTYAQEVDQEKFLEYGRAQKKYLKFAQKVLDEAYRGKTEADLLAMRGRIMTQKEVTAAIKLFLKEHGISKRYKISWSKDYVIRTTITAHEIKLRLPCNYHQDEVNGMIWHEIGTHGLRRINYEQQPWFKKKKKYGFRSYLKTEEGLATLNAMLAHNYPIGFYSALRYLLVDVALNGSFVDAYDFLAPYISDDKKRWNMAYRAKRGVEDTSLPGGYSKDLVYFEGMVEVWHYLQKNNFDPTDLYIGKIAWEDIKLAKKLNPNFKPLLPNFYTNDPAAFAKKMKEIGQVNFLG